MPRSSRCYWHCSEVQTPAALDDEPVIPRSIKFPAGIVIALVDVHFPFVAREQLSDELCIAPIVPTRNVTVIVPDCCEYTSSSVAVHPSGTHASTEVVSVRLPVGEFTE